MLLYLEFYGHDTHLEIRGLFKKYAECLIARLELFSGDSAWGRQVRTVQLIKTPFSDRRYLHLLISYTVLSKECFFRLSDCKIDSLKEQRIAVKFCVKLGKFATETYAMSNTACGDVGIKRTACFK